MRDSVIAVKNTLVKHIQRNLSVRINEHQNKTKISEPAKHLKHFPDHSFTWRVITPTMEKTQDYGSLVHSGVQSITE